VSAEGLPAAAAVVTGRVLERDSALSKPTTKRGKLERAALTLLLEHERDDALPTSNRFVFYEAEQRGTVSKRRTGKRRADQDFTDASMSIREKGIVPFDWIVDETREVTEWSFADSVAAYARDAVKYARIDCWDGEPPPLILCESRSLAGVLRRIAAEYLCPITSTNGQVGGFLVTQVAPRLRNGRRVLYLGDYDHQGGQIERATRRRLESEVGPIAWERLALTGEQVEEHDLARLTIRKEDRRYRKDSPDRFHDAIETEALSQTIIVGILRDRLDQLLPEPLDDVLERERQQREDYSESDES
jgi:hypothetical protein